MLPTARLDAQSSVPGIITFMDAFHANNAVHIVLEYMDMGSLAGVLRERGPLPGVV